MGINDVGELGIRDWELLHKHNSPFVQLGVLALLWRFYRREKRERVRRRGVIVEWELGTWSYGESIIHPSCNLVS